MVGVRAQAVRRGPWGPRSRTAITRAGLSTGRSMCVEACARVDRHPVVDVINPGDVGEVLDQREIDQRAGLEKESAPHQENINGKNKPRTVSSQAHPRALEGHALLGNTDALFHVAKANQQKEGGDNADEFSK